MKRLISLVVGILFMCTFSSLFGAEVTTVTIWTPHDFDVRYKDKGVYETLWRPFEEEHPNIKIQWTRVPDWEQKFRIAAAAGQLPDIFAVDGINVPAYATRGLLEPLDRWVPKEVQRDYWRPALEEMTWDGKLYAVGLETNAHLLYYNTALFKNAGISKPPTSWEELVSIGQKLTQDFNGDGKIDQFGLSIPLGRNEYVMWILSAFIWANKGDIISPDGTRAVCNEPKAVEAVQFLSDLVNKYKIVPKAGQIQAGPEGAFIGQKVAMEYGGTFNLGPWQKYLKTVPWKVTFTPGAVKGTRVSGVGGWHFAMWSGSKNKEAAGEVIKYLTSPYMIKTLASSYGIALRMSISKEMKQDSTYPWSVGIAQMKVGRPRPRHPEYPTITDAMQQAFDNAILGGIPPKQALDEAARRINEVLKKK
jgi:multiple sugar transport system substrate-binding protein